jgi:hypothetical protein
VDEKVTIQAGTFPARGLGAPVGARAAHQRPAPTLNEIHDRALQKWAAAGRPWGDGTRFWLEAEQELLREQ